MITRDDITMRYGGSPERGLMFEASFLRTSTFVMGENQQENCINAVKAVNNIIDYLYGDIRESLNDILEEYQMRHGGHSAGHNKLQGMIEELIDKIPM